MRKSGLLAALIAAASMGQPPGGELYKAPPSVPLAPSRGQLGGYRKPKGFRGSVAGQKRQAIKRRNIRARSSKRGAKQ